MTKKQMYFRMLFHSLLRRKSRMLVGLLAVTLGSSIVFGLATICYDIPEQMLREFRSYGANMVLFPSGTAEHLDLTEVAKAKKLLEGPDLVGLTPYRYQTVRINIQPCTAVGTDFNEAKKTSPYWRLEGKWPSGENEIVVGSDLAEFMKLESGRKIPISGKNAKGRRFNQEVTITGILRTGGTEDGFIFMSLAMMEHLMGNKNFAEVVEVSIAASSEKLQEIATELHKDIPSITPQLVKRVAHSEASVLSRLQTLVYLVTVVVLVLTMICVATTMMTVVLERRKEIGLKKALGAENKDVICEFLGEGIFLGLFGGLLGAVLGFLFAQTISLHVFGRAIAMNFLLALATVIFSIVVTVLASFLPVRQVTDIEPALVLRGE